MSCGIIDDLINFPGAVSKGEQFRTACFSECGNELYQIWNEISQSSALPMQLLDFRSVAVLKPAHFKLDGLESNIKAKCHTFHPRKIRGRLCEISKSTFQAQPTSQSLLYFWRRAAARAGKCSIFSAQISGEGDEGKRRQKKS